MSAQNQAFERTLLETVEMALLQVLGEKITTALRFYVDLQSALKNPDRFIAVMFELVGPRQSEALRERILEELQKRLNVAQRPEGARFSEQLSMLKTSAGGPST